MLQEKLLKKKKTIGQCKIEDLVESDGSCNS